MKFRAHALTTTLFSLALTALAGAALAHDHRDNGRHEGWRRHHQDWDGPRVIYAPAPSPRYYHAPPPRVVYAPPPVVYAAPPMMIEQPAPSINFIFPLR